jgi:hypothetical protein
VSQQRIDVQLHDLWKIHRELRHLHERELQSSRVHRRLASIAREQLLDARS